MHIIKNIYTYAWEYYQFLTINVLSDATSKGHGQLSIGYRVIWKSDLIDKMKRSFFQAVVVSILL